MSIKKGFIGVAVFLAFVLGLNPLFSQDVKPFKPWCCIAGKYEGFFKDNPSTTCKDPKSGTSIMIIKQDKKCGGKIWGTVTAEDGTVQEFKGTVSPTLKGCCEIKAVVRMKKSKEELLTKEPIKEPEQAEIKGTMCKAEGKWVLKNGTYKTNRGCTGVFELKQQ